MTKEIRWFASILLILFCTACTLEDETKSKKDPELITVTFDANGGSGSAPPVQKGQAGTNITLPNAVGLSRVNHTFEGWNTSVDGVGINYPAGSSFTMPSTNTTLYAKWDKGVERTERTEYATAGNYAYTFNKGSPATIEVYALGAGGGGQGGHYSFNIPNSTRGTGGAGGGGAATYMQFSATGSVTFNITIGGGGNPGTARQVDIGTWQSGYPGGDGGDTTVRWGTNTLTARGGKGGGGDGQILTGGLGGSVNTTWPSGNLDRLSVAGEGGTTGIFSGDIISKGGNAASISRGSEETSFGGSGGGYRAGNQWLKAADGTRGGGGSSAYGGTGGQNNGGRGGDGQVIIVVTY